MSVSYGMYESSLQRPLQGDSLGFGLGLRDYGVLGFRISGSGDLLASGFGVAGYAACNLEFEVFGVSG